MLVFEDAVPPPPVISIREWIAVVGLLVLLFAFDLLTFNRSPTVWCDDVSFTEPAINFLLHGSYTTTVWQFQPLNTFPAVNCPLYSQLIAGWCWTFGTNLLAVRAFNYLLMGVACLLFWLLLHRFGLVSSARWRIALVAVFHLGYGISFAYRCSRPDTLGLVLTLALGIVFTVKSVRWRSFGLLALSTLLPWVSLNAGMYAGLACFCGWVVLRRPRFGQATIVWTGLLLGVLSVAWFLASKGALQNFITGASHVVGLRYAVSAGSSVASRALRVVQATVPNYFVEYSTGVLLLGTVALLLWRWRELRGLARWRLIAGVALTLFATPLVFNFVGHYAFYYSYTIFTPALILFALVALPAPASSTTPGKGRLAGLAAAATLLAATVVGLPMRVAAASYFAEITPRAAIQRRVDACISADDVVYTDETVFFEVKQRAKVVYTRWSSMDFMTTRVPGRRFTQSEKDSVTKLVVAADQAGSVTRFFGGRWEAVTELFGDSTHWERVKNFPLLKKKIQNYLDQPQTSRYRLKIFRRVPAS